MDQESEEVANGASNLATVILQQKGDLIKAEELAREYLHIRTLIFGSDADIIGGTNMLLADILVSQGKFGNKTKELLEGSLTIFMRQEGPNGSNTAAEYVAFVSYHHKYSRIQTTVDLKCTQLLLAISYYEEGLRGINLN
jgi:hypothetical protein